MGTGAVLSENNLRYLLRNDVRASGVLSQRPRRNTGGQLPEVIVVHLCEKSLRLERSLDYIDLHHEKGLGCVLERERVDFEQIVHLLR